MTSSLGILYMALVDTMRFLMLLLRSLTLIRMYRRKAFMDHLPMVMIVSRYNMARKSSVENPYRSEWGPTYLCENPRRSSPKYSVPDLIFLIII